jgi:hypothetical protein
MGYRVSGIGFRVESSEVRAQGIWVSGFMAQGIWYKV